MNKTQILVVEDEGIVAKDLQAMLRGMGYHVPATVGTGDAAIQTAAQNQPDLILMDIQLRGGIDGVQAAAAINSQQDVPILYLTANSDEATLQRAKGTAPFGFLVKPFEERAIQAGIEMALYKHQTDKQMREREQWLSTTLTSIADAVITTDAAGNITFLNAAAEELSGWTFAEALGCPYSKVFLISAEANEPALSDRVAAALLKGESGSFNEQTVLVRHDGSEKPIVHSVAPIRQGRDKQIDGCVIVFNDISERRKLEDQLRHAQKMDAIGKLAGGIAHDFNNAITAIIGYAELIMRKTEKGTQFHEDAGQIVRAGEHSARLTHQLLAFSRKQVLQPRCLDLQQELAGVEGLVRRLIGTNIRLVTKVAPDLWRTMADAGQMQQVVMNMAINARDAMTKGGQLTIELSNVSLTPLEALRIQEGISGDFVLLKITDTGSGMSPDIMRRIFEPFFTTKGPGKGTGLGLATCFGIIKQTSGMISVASEVGVGTSFFIYLPKANSSRSELEYGLEVEGPVRGSETILVVEDEDILRELAVQVLESFGYRVLAAADGFEAVTILQREAHQIDLVLSDLVMPRMGGRELVTWMREKYGHIRVVFTSGYTDDEIVRAAIEGAEVEYIQKPYTPNALTQKIRRVLDGPKAVEAAA